MRSRSASHCESQHLSPRPDPVPKYRLRKNLDRRPVTDHQQDVRVTDHQDEASAGHDQQQEETDQEELRLGSEGFPGQSPHRAAPTTGDRQTSQYTNPAQHPHHHTQAPQLHDPTTQLLEAEQACNARLRTRNRVLTGSWQAERMKSRRSEREKDAVIRELEARADQYGVMWVAMMMLLASGIGYLLWCWLNAAEFEYLSVVRRREWGVVER